MITFDPHPRIALGNEVELITTLERRLELFAELGVESTLVAPFTPGADGARAGDVRRALPAARSARTASRPAPDFRFGAKRRGDLELLERLGFEILEVVPVPGVSSSAIRAALRERRRRRGGGAARAAVRARRHRRRRRPARRHARLPDREPRARAAPRLPAYGIYAGSALEHRAAVSIGTNPHYGGTERRIEPFLLDFDGDLYGKRLVVEVWERLRDEAVFASEEELIAQIGRDVEATARAPSAPTA